MYYKEYFKNNTLTFYNLGLKKEQKHSKSSKMPERCLIDWTRSEKQSH